ncbi:MAG: hypothetical protein JSW63_03770 [Ignavibacterium sp.]|nr:MAG: hypothetical protein JSW63_03770 [Ignavibacterium sp.]
MITSYIFRISMFAGLIIVLASVLFGYLFFEPFLTEKEEIITITNMQKWGKEPGKYFIFTEDEVFLNSNDYYHNKTNAEELFPLFKKGYTYKVKVIGVYLPFLPRFRNIKSIMEFNSNKYKIPK